MKNCVVVQSSRYLERYQPSRWKNIFEVVRILPRTTSKIWHVVRGTSKLEAYQLWGTSKIFEVVQPRTKFGVLPTMNVTYGELHAMSVQCTPLWHAARTGNVAWQHIPHTTTFIHIIMNLATWCNWDCKPRDCLYGTLFLRDMHSFTSPLHCCFWATKHTMGPNCGKSV